MLQEKRVFFQNSYSPYSGYCIHWRTAVPKVAVFVYSRINYGSTEHDIIVLTKGAPSLNLGFFIKGSWL